MTIPVHPLCSYCQESPGTRHDCFLTILQESNLSKKKKDALEELYTDKAEETMTFQTAINRYERFVSALGKLNPTLIATAYDYLKDGRTDDQE